jgi:hypothetical protein
MRGAGFEHADVVIFENNLMDIRVDNGRVLSFLGPTHGEAQTEAKNQKSAYSGSHENLRVKLSPDILGRAPSTGQAAVFN